MNNKIYSTFFNKKKNVITKYFVFKRVMKLLSTLSVYEPRHINTCFLHIKDNGAYQLRSNCTADQPLCFRFIELTSGRGQNAVHDISSKTLLLNTTFRRIDSWST